MFCQPLGLSQAIPSRHLPSEHQNTIFFFGLAAECLGSPTAVSICLQITKRTFSTLQPNRGEKCTANKHKYLTDAEDLNVFFSASCTTLCALHLKSSPLDLNRSSPHPPTPPE
jgi:hypothetical protein